MSEIRFIAEQSRAAVISITETWLDDSITDEEVSINDYCIIRKDRNRNGGGVCTYIRNDLASNIRTDISDHTDEFLWIELLLPKTKPIIVGTCYRPPNQSNFTDRFEESLFNLRSDSETIILGDFNICLFKKASSLYKAYVNIYGFLI